MRVVKKENTILTAILMYRNPVFFMTLEAVDINYIIKSFSDYFLFIFKAKSVGGDFAPSMQA